MDVVYWLILVAGCTAIGVGVWVARRLKQAPPWPTALACSGLGLSQVAKAGGHFGWPWPLTAGCTTLGLVLLLTGVVTLAIRKRSAGAP